MIQKLLSVVEVIEHQARQRNVAKIVVGGWAAEVGKFGGFGMKTERRHREEMAGLILKFPQLDKVVDALFNRFDMTVEHRGVLTEAELRYCGSGRPSSTPRHSAFCRTARHALGH